MRTPTVLRPLIVFGAIGTIPTQAIADHVAAVISEPYSTGQVVDQSAQISPIHASASANGPHSSSSAFAFAGAGHYGARASSVATYSSGAIRPTGRSEALVDASDSFTITRHGTLPGMVGEINARVAITSRSFVDATGDANAADAWLTFSMTASQAISNTISRIHINQISRDGPSGSEYFASALINDTPFSYSEAFSGILKIPFQFGHAINLHYNIRASAGAGAMENGSSSASIDFGNSFRWLGIESLTVDGNAITDYTSESITGFDYSRLRDVPAVPEPSSLSTMMLGLAVLVGLAYRSRKFPRQQRPPGELASESKGLRECHAGHGDQCRDVVQRHSEPAEQGASVAPARS